MKNSEIINFIHFDLNGSVIEIDEKQELLSKIISNNQIPESFLSELEQKEPQIPFTANISDKISIIAQYIKSDNNYQIAYFDYTQQAEYIKSMQDTYEDFEEALVESENYRSEYIELSEKLQGALDELNKANDIIVEKNLQIQKELEMASKLQYNLLPKEFPFEKHFEYGHKYKPTHHIGGDIFDIVKISDTQMFVVVADVSGHGVTSSLVTAMFKTAFQHHAPNFKSPAELFNTVNKELSENLHGNFITTFVCLIDTEKEEISYANAGHPDMLILHQDGKLDMLKSTGMMLGLFEEEEYEEKTAELKHGSKIFFFTDGIAEADNSEGEIFGIERINEIYVQTVEANPEKTIEIIYKDITKFTKNKPFDDDITLLVIKRN